MRTDLLQRGWLLPLPIFAWESTVAVGLLVVLRLGASARLSASSTTRSLCSDHGASDRVVPCQEHMNLCLQ